MPSLEEELSGDQDPRIRCATCTWIEAMSVKDRAEWDSAINARVGAKFRFTHASVHRAMLKRGSVIKRSNVERHRVSGHRA